MVIPHAGKVVNGEHPFLNPIKISRRLINIVSKILNIFSDSHINIKPLFIGSSIQQTETTELWFLCKY